AFRLDTAAGPGALTNLGAAVVTLALGGDDFLPGVSESADAARDLNGDGDTNDVVLHFFDLADASPSPRNLLAVATAFSFFRFDVDEIRVGALLAEGQPPNFDDLNQDGDTTDNGVVLLGADPSLDPPGGVLETPFFAGTASAGIAPPLRVGSDVFAFPSSEAMRAIDFNGDGDMTDTVLRYARYRP
ncbi:MAG: hypothetical protein ACE5JG_11600, partial [Planctomycetota bacterium]